MSADNTDESVPEMARYFVGFIKKGSNWSGEVTPEAEKIQTAHRANIKRLEGEGKMVLSGPFEEDGELRGLFFYVAEDMQAAQILVDTDPAVMAGQLTVELHAWWGTAKLKDI